LVGFSLSVIVRDRKLTIKDYSEKRVKYLIMGKSRDGVKINLNERAAEWIIDKLIREKGWNNDPQDSKCNVFRQRTYKYWDQKDNKEKIKRPDYVFYDNFQSPLFVLEVKKPNEKLIECLEKAKEVCRIIKAPLAVASDAFVYHSHHLHFEREYLINNRPLNVLPTLQEALPAHNNYFYTTYRGRVLNNQEEFEELLKKVDDKLRECGLTEGEERFVEFCKLLFLRLISQPNDPQSSLVNIATQSETQNLKAIINSELKKHQANYKIGKFSSSLQIKDPIIIREIIQEINTIDFVQSDFDAKGAIFEYFLGKKGNNDLAQYFTPRTVVRFMVNYLSPKLEEKVYDPFCGTGGMLIEAFTFLWKQTLTFEGKNP
jgi:type I restriction enzyme M protein